MLGWDRVWRLTVPTRFAARAGRAQTGYREGLAAGKEDHVQEGFNVGYRDGCHLGLDIGLRRGALRSALAGRTRARGHRAPS